MKTTPLFALVLLLCAFLSGCALGLGGKKDSAEKNDSEAKLRLQPVPINSLTGYQPSPHQGFMEAFEKSCTAILAKPASASYGPNDLGGTVADWQPACQAVRLSKGAMAPTNLLSNYFQAYRVYEDTDPEGLFTGYYEPLLQGSWEKSERYATPLYLKPETLISADLGAFSEDLKGKIVYGKVKDDRLIPFDSRADIEAGSLADQATELIWVDNPVEAFFLHIQGSGSVDLPDGQRIRVGYASQNGRAYYAIGRELIKREILTKENVSLQTIRAWLEANPEQAVEVMQLNPSYIFFHKVEGDGPLGAQGVALTPETSLAVDRRLIPYGTPVWLDAEDPLQPDARFRKLMVAQDTGGAIRGAVRGDVFWGSGDMAAEKAGRMKSKGGYWIFLPQTIEIPEKYRYEQKFWTKIKDKLIFW
jgi:membrane-bound lytic murein transglycosylase A